jgi:hypothetical protein
MMFRKTNVAIIEVVYRNFKRTAFDKRCKC